MVSNSELEFGETSPLVAQKRDTLVLSKELTLFFKLAWPVVTTYVLEFLPGFVSTIFVGHLHGKKDLDATALATMYFNIFGLAIGIGFATAMDTLCAQANGAGVPTQIGIYLQRGLIVLSGVAAVVMSILWYASEVLILLGQDLAVSEMAGHYCRVLVPGLPMFFLYEMMKKCLQSQWFYRSMFIAGINNALNVCFCFLFIHVWGWGYLGAAVARTLAVFVGTFLLVVYAMWGEGHNVWWGGWDAAAAWNREGLWEWLCMGTPGCLMVCVEWCAFDSASVLAGWLPDRTTALGANLICLNLTQMVYLLYLGVGVAATVRVGNLLGEGQPATAKSVASLAMGVGLCVSGLTASLLIACRSHIPPLFSNNQDISTAVEATLNVVAAYALPDSINCIAANILTGCGKQSLGAKVYLATFYPVGLPLSYGLAFWAHLNLRGIWWGMTVSVAASAALMAMLVVRVDWAECSFNARDRTRSIISEKSEYK